MIAEIINGKLVLFPANQTEHYAAIQWRASSQVFFEDPKRNETQFIRGSTIEFRPPACAT